MFSYTKRLKIPKYRTHRIAFEGTTRRMYFHNFSSVKCQRHCYRTGVGVVLITVHLVWLVTSGHDKGNVLDTWIRQQSAAFVVRKAIPLV